jgi:uncharacterized membrane protein YraQ (UPF0718 family)
VLPAAVSLRKQGANKGAVTAFLISTPESGVDSISITYALLDPLMTVMRPVAAFFTASIAGIAENIRNTAPSDRIQSDPSCPVDNCCDGVNCGLDTHHHHHSFSEKLYSCLTYAFSTFWSELAGYFFIGLILAGLILVSIPDDFFSVYLGTGLPAILIMLAAGIPLYVCATASTPVAAALILKGISPGAALVFLLVGPATNVATLTMLIGILGKRSVAVYLATISVCAVFFGLLVDASYALLNISPVATMGQAGEILPDWLSTAGAVILLLISIRPLWHRIKKLASSRFRTT